MNKSKIVFALLTGVAIGSVVAYAIKTASEENDEQILKNETNETSKLDSIAQQFSEKISTELKAAEKKIRTAVQKEIDALSPEKELGLFL